MPCRRHGGSSACPSAAFARPGRSCRRRLCSPRTAPPRTRRSSRRCPAISAAAVAISASMRRSVLRREESESCCIIWSRKRARRADARRSIAIIENVSRRQFVGGALTASGLVLAVRIAPASALEPLKPYPTGGLDMPDGYGMAHDPHVYVAIDPDGAVTIVAHRSEMGTGIRTSLPMVIADEMEADWSRVKLVQAPGDEPRYGNQDTDGSRSMRHFIQPMRECGAAMRQMLETAAAAKWGVDVFALPREGASRGAARRGEEGNRARSSASASWRKRPWRCRCRRARRCCSRRRTSSRSCARARPRSSTCATSPWARPCTAPISGCRA